MQDERKQAWSPWSKNVVEPADGLVTNLPANITPPWRTCAGDFSADKDARKENKLGFLGRSWAGGFSS